MSISLKPKSLYIHIPFCNSICNYCDFTKVFYNELIATKYIGVLLKEIDSYNIKNGALDTIYIGGGTPSCLSSELIEKILSKVKLFLKNNGEFTIECNVDSINEEKLLIFKKYNINRLSIGIQSSNDSMLKFMNRKHTFDDAKKRIEEAKKIGFNNINVDLIYGLPGQSINDIENDLENFISLNVNHISIYSLTIHKGCVFYNKKINEQSQDESRDFYDLILKTMRKEGYIRYEVSNFCKNNSKSRHNLTYWTNNRYYGVGLGASGYINNKRYTNTKNLTKYLNNNYIDYEENISLEDEMFYYLMLNFRLEEGFLLDEFKTTFNILFEDRFNLQIKKLINEKLIVLKDNRAKLSDEGIMLLDTVIQTLFKE